jgi:hypothetical protein
MKKVCDHCGGGVEKERDDTIVVWCKSCVDEDYELLNAAGLSAAGMPMTFNKGYGEFSAGMTENVKRAKSIPPKGSKPNMNGDIFPSLKVEVAETKTMELPHQSEPAFDFDKYNSTIPGWGHGYR